MNSVNRKEIIAEKKRIDEIEKKASERDKKRIELQSLLKKYKGGTVAFRSEKWNYDASGETTLLNTGETEKLVYIWDGETFNPKEKSFGAGLWDGKKLCWYLKANEVFKISGQTSIWCSYIWNEKQKEFVPESRPANLEVASWGVLNEESPILVSKSSDVDKWITTGSVPPIVVMMLQVLSYSRIRDRKSTPKEGHSSHSLRVQNKLYSYRGYVELKEGDSKIWKIKYLVLDDSGNDVFIYNKEEETSAISVRNNNVKFISLTDYSCSTTMKREKYCIILKPGLKRNAPSSPSSSGVFQLLVPSKAERDGWMAALISHGVIKSGVIKEGFLRSREKYYFVLQKNCLYYHANQEDSIYGKIKGQIDLFNCTVKETNQGSLGRKTTFSFGIYQPSGKKYFLFSDTATDVNEWIIAIRKVIDEAKSSALRRGKLLNSQVSAVWELEEEDLESTKYPFDEPDSDENIQFMESTDPPTIRAATLTKLIERLTFDEYADVDYLADFLLTFRSFTSPNELLSLLKQRFNMPFPKNPTEVEKQNFERKITIIRLRVYNFLKQWIETFPKDFDGELGDKVLLFINERMSTIKSMEAAADQLKNKLLKRTSSSSFVSTIGSSAPSPILPAKKRGSGITEKLTFMDIDSEEMARQITLLDYELYKSIKPWEFFDKTLSKKKRTDESNLLKMIDRFNELSKWVATEIVFVDELKKRIGALAKWIEIGDKCRKLNNFSAVMAIVSALQSTGVFRLKQTWAGITSSQRETFEKLKKVMSREGNFRIFRQTMRDIVPPSVPYIGVYLTDLTFIEDGNPDFVGDEETLINFVKRRMIAAVLREVQQYQHTPYNFEVVPWIREMILEDSGLEENECYDVSLKFEPRGGGTFKVKDLSPEEKAVFDSFRIKRANKVERRKSSATSSVSSIASVSSSASNVDSKRTAKMQELLAKFHAALSDGNLDKVKSLLQQGIMLTNLFPNGQSALHIAAFEGRLEIIDFLLSLKESDYGKLDINARDSVGWTALHCASSGGYLDIVEKLLQNKADPTLANREKNLPIHYWSRRNPELVKKTKKSKQNPIPLEETQYARILKQMIDAGVDVNAQNEYGDTPLHQAAASGNDDAIILLLKSKAKIMITNSMDEFPSKTAERSQQEQSRILLKDAEDEFIKKKEKRQLIRHSDVTPDNLYQVVQLMQHQEHGVKLDNHKRLGGLLTYKRCFLGSEAVDWMIETLGLHNRHEATIQGQKLVDSHFISHVVKASKPFRDSNKDFYRFLSDPDFQAWKAKISSLRQTENQPSLTDFDFVSIIGEGLVGKVLLARNKQTSKLYAFKMMEKSEFSEEGDLDTLLSEKRILQNDSAFLVHLHFTFVTKSHVFLVMDYIPGGDLAFHLKQHEVFTESHAKFITAELVLALDYLQSRGVVYRDLKPENILFDRDGHVVLTDFGLSKISTSTFLQTACGSPAYTAPEVLSGSPYTKAIDWWSLGVVLYQMLLGFTPFEFNDDLGELIRNILNGRILYPEDHVSPNAKSLLEAFLQKNPKQRLEDVDEIKNHPFFFGMDWTALAVKKVPSPLKIELQSDDDVSYFNWDITSQPIEDAISNLSFELDSTFDENKN